MRSPAGGVRQLAPAAQTPERWALQHLRKPVSLDSLGHNTAGGVFAHVCVRVNRVRVNRARAYGLMPTRAYGSMPTRACGSMPTRACVCRGSACALGPMCAAMCLVSNVKRVRTLSQNACVVL